ncbi:MAG: SH3 domain-containing protein, partial [Halobacteria archaeon]
HRAAIIKLNALLCKKFRLRPAADTIVYHHWFDLNSGERKNGAGVTKSCPGTAFFDGNKVAHAEANFYPLIRRAIQSLEVEPIKLGSVLYIARVTVDALNVRSQPATSGVRVKVLTKRTLVNVYEERDKWCRIDPVQSHWVNKRFLERVTA